MGNTNMWCWFQVVENFGDGKDVLYKILVTLSPCHEIFYTLMCGRYEFLLSGMSGMACQTRNQIIKLWMEFEVGLTRYLWVGGVVSCPKLQLSGYK